MNYRFMRVIVLFDLPMETLGKLREYNKFRKFLIRSGFIQMQKSVYCKLALNKTVSSSIKNSIKKNKPSEGLIQILEITENQYLDIEYILGSSKSNVLDSDKRLVEYD